MCTFSCFPLLGASPHLKNKQKLVCQCVHRALKAVLTTMLFYPFPGSLMALHSKSELAFWQEMCILVELPVCCHGKTIGQKMIIASHCDSINLTIY